MIPIDDWRASAQYFSAGDADIAFWTSHAEPHEDDLPVLLFIHGYPTSSWDWSALWPALENKFRLIALDMLGFGLSDKPKNVRYSILQQADFQEALLGHLGVSEAHVFTHDYGNTVGQELLARHQEGGLSFALKSMCFLNGGLFPEQHRARAIQKLGLTPLGPLLGLMLSEKQLKKSFDEIFGPETKASDTEIAGHWSMIAHNQGEKVVHKLLQYIPERRQYRERWVGALKTATTPLRLIDGGFDPVSGEHLFHYYKQEIPNADAVLLPQVGHYPHTEAPQEILKHFLEFHQNIAPVTRS